MFEEKVLAEFVATTFECSDKSTLHRGHGEQFETSTVLFNYLGKEVEGVDFSVSDSVFRIFFGEEELIKVIPEKNGLESYVVTTRYGIDPLMI